MVGNREYFPAFRRVQDRNKHRTCRASAQPQRTRSCLEFEGTPGGKVSEEDRGHHQAIQARRGEGGASGSRTAGYHRAEYIVDFLPKVKIEIVIGDDLVEKAIDAIRRAAQTGRIGDGKIFVSNIEEAIRIRTGESGLDAI